MQSTVLVSHEKPIKTVQDFCDSLLKAVRDIKEEKSPGGLCDLEAAITRDELQSVATALATKETKEEANAKTLKPFIDFLERRWERIKGRTGQTYFDLPQHSATQVCLTLAKLLSPIVGKSVYQLLIPNLATDRTVLGEDLNNTPLHLLALSNPIGDKILLIHLLESLENAKETREFRHTSRLDRQLIAGELLDPSEIDIFKKHSTLTSSFHRAITNVQKAMNSLSMGYLIDLCLKGFEAGGEKKTGDYYNAAAIANRNMMALIQVMELLTPEERTDLYSRQSGDITFKECIDKIANPQAFKDQYGEVPCIEITAGNMRQVLEANMDLHNKNPKHIKRIIDMLSNIEMETKEMKQRPGSSLANAGFYALFKELEGSSKAFASKLEHDSDDYVASVRPILYEPAYHDYIKKIYNLLLADDYAGLKKYATDSFVITTIFTVLNVAEQQQFLQILNKAFGKEQLGSIFKTEESLAQILSFSLRGHNKAEFLEVVGVPYVLSQINRINSLTWYVKALPETLNVDMVDKLIGLDKFNKLASEAKDISSVVTTILERLSSFDEKMKFISTYCNDKMDKIIFNAQSFSNFIAKLSTPITKINASEARHIAIADAKNRALMLVTLMKKPYSIDFAKLIDSPEDFPKIVEFLIPPLREFVLNNLAKNQLKELISDIRPEVFAQNFLKALPQQESALLKHISSRQLQEIAGDEEGLAKILRNQREEVQVLILNHIGEDWLKKQLKHKAGEVIQTFFEIGTCNEKVQAILLKILNREILKKSLFATGQLPASASVVPAESSTERETQEKDKNVGQTRSL